MSESGLQKPLPRQPQGYSFQFMGGNTKTQIRQHPNGLPGRNLAPRSFRAPGWSKGSGEDGLLDQAATGGRTAGEPSQV